MTGWCQWSLIITMSLKAGGKLTKWSEVTIGLWRTSKTTSGNPPEPWLGPICPVFSQPIPLPSCCYIWQELQHLTMKKHISVQSVVYTVLLTIITVIDYDWLAVPDRADVMPAFFSSLTRSPFWWSSIIMSQPPINSPFIYIWGIVGQFE